jgi:hypothetical protein
MERLSRTGSHFDKRAFRVIRPQTLRTRPRARDRQQWIACVDGEGGLRHPTAPHPVSQGRGPVALARWCD